MRVVLLATSALIATITGLMTPCFAAEGETGEFYFLLVEGRGVPVKQVVLNGTNVLGGSVLSVKMPINVTSDIQAGLNELEVDYVSDENEGLVTRIEKRTDGPKVTEIAKISSKANESNGKLAHKTLSFNVSRAPIKEKDIELTDGDKEEIIAAVKDYYSALNEKNASKLRNIYSAALKKESRVCPENANYFNRVLKKEISLLRREDVKMSPFKTEDISIQVEQNIVKVVHKDRKPLMQSNEIEIEVEPLMTELGDKSEPKKEKVKQRLVTTKLLFKKSDGKWRLALPQGV